ncbi:MAG: flippase-like domain-containing protein [Candidatus Cloacimonetes bacterium]|nr:flippase-like domain-containing protein [Candidatus Cloacimonadota bacterium]
MNKRNLSLLTGLILGLVMILVWLHYVDVSQMRLHMLKADLGLIGLAVLLYLSAYFIRSIRWNLLLRQKVQLSIWQTWIFVWGGNFVNYLIPIRLGELVKAWFVRRHHQIPVAQSLPSIFIDKFFDTIAIFFILITLFFIPVGHSKAMLILVALSIIVFLVFLAMILMAVFFRVQIVSILNRFFGWLPKRLREKVAGNLEMFISGLNMFEHHWMVLVGAVLLTVLGVVLDGLYFFYIILAFGQQLPFFMVLFGYTLINLSYALPQPPAQLGSNEWMMIIVFSIGFGLTKDSAAAIMASAHILTAVIISLLGVIAFGISGFSILKTIFKGEQINAK